MITITNTKVISAARMTALVYGEPGVGKTTLARTLSAAGHSVLILSAESGLLSLAGTDIDVIEVGKGEDDRGAAIAIDPRKHLREILGWLKSERRPYEWLFIDSLTEIGQRMVAYLKEQYPDRKDRFPLWEDYTDTMRAMVKAFRDLNWYSVVFTALPAVEKDQDGRRFYGVDLNGKISQQLPALIDEVFALRNIADDHGHFARWLSTQPIEINGTTWIGKDRSGKLGLYEAPDLAAIAAKVIRKDG